MKRTILSLLCCTTALVLVFTSCKKKSDDVAPDNAAIAEQISNAADQGLFSDASNEVLNSINRNLNAANASRLGDDGSGTRVNGKIDTLTITYTDYNEDLTLQTSGKIKVYLVDPLKRWYDKNAQWKIDFGSGLVVTRVSDSRKLKLTGMKTITNLTGGNAGLLTATDSVVHKVEGAVTLLFDNETTSRVWNISRVRNIKKNPDHTTQVRYHIVLSGTGTRNSYTNVAEYGTNRFGNEFVTSIDKPLVLQYCTNKYIFTSGTVNYHGVSKDFVVTFGVDKNGDAVSSACSATGYKVNYTNAAGALVTYIRTY